MIERIITRHQEYLLMLTSAEHVYKIKFNPQSSFIFINFQLSPMRFSANILVEIKYRVLTVEPTWKNGQLSALIKLLYYLDSQQIEEYKTTLKLQEIANENSLGHSIPNYL